MIKWLKTQTIKDSVIVTASMGISSLLSAVSIFLIARFLGPADFGLYVAALAVAIITIDAVELAISNSIVKFASQNSPESPAYVKYGWQLKLFLGLLLGLVFSLLSQPLARLINPGLQPALLMVSLFIPTVFLFRFPRSVLQAQRRFLADSSLEVIASLLRLLFVILFYHFFRLTVISSLLASLLGVLICFFIGASYISWDFLQAASKSAVRQKFFDFQKWLTLGFIIAAVHGRIDSLLLLRLSGETATGIYQAAYRFFMPVIQLAAALSLVFAPRFASFANFQQAKTYLNKAVKLSLAVAVAVLLIIPLSPWLVKLIFGSAYSAAVLPAQVLSLGFCAFVFGAPFVSHLIYSTQRTKVFFWINCLQLFLLVSLDFYLIPKLGSLGAALATTSTLIIINSLMAVLALSYHEKKA